MKTYDQICDDNMKLRAQLRFVKAQLERNELKLCGDCHGKGYEHTNGCHLCDHERRIRQRIKDGG